MNKVARCKQFLLFPCLLVTSVAVQAEVIPMKLMPGLWEESSSTTLNGQNMQSAIRQMQEQMMAKMSPEERAQMQSAMGGRDGSGKKLVCLSPEQVARGINVDKIKKQIEQDSGGNCAVSSWTVNASGGKFNLSCASPTGEKQQGQGEFIAKNNKEWSFHLTSGGDMPGAGGKPQKYQAVVQSRSVWKSSDCGTVRPEE